MIWLSSQTKSNLKTNVMRTSSTFSIPFWIYTKVFKKSVWSQGKLENKLQEAFNHNLKSLKKRWFYENVFWLNWNHGLSLHMKKSVRCKLYWRILSIFFTLKLSKERLKTVLNWMSDYYDFGTISARFLVPSHFSAKIKFLG